MEATMSARTRRVVTELAHAARRIPAGPLARLTLRSGLWGAAVDSAIGGVEAWWAVRKGADPEIAKGHILHKAANGFVVGSVGSLCAAVALSVSGPGLVAFAAGSLGAAGASRLFNKAAGPSPLKEARETQRKTAKKRAVRRTATKTAKRRTRRAKA